MTLDIKGRVSVVTGGAQSIGLGIAQALCEEGSRVALLDIAADKAAEAAAQLRDSGYEAAGYPVDVTDRDAVHQTIARISDAWEPASVLVNNAGVVDQRPFEEIRPEQMDLMMRVNVHGTLYCAQAVSSGMKRQGYGRIINLSSKSGKTGSALMAHYSAAKGAVIALTHALAFELAPHNITANCLCPGITDHTGVWGNVSKGYVENLGLSRDQVVEKFAAKIPLGRLTSIEDVANFVVFLATKGDYCTGQAFNITGGREVH